MEVKTEITRKDISFINDIDLREILRERLNELDRVVIANAHYSTVFLAISTIEGIFKHIGNIYKAEIKNSRTCTIFLLNVMYFPLYLVSSTFMTSIEITETSYTPRLIGKRVGELDSVKRKWL